MKVSQAWVAWAVIIACGWSASWAADTARAPAAKWVETATETTLSGTTLTRVWISPDRKSTFRLYETAVAKGGPMGVRPRQVLKMSLSVQASNGAIVEQWQWTPGDSGYDGLVDDVLVAQSGQRFCVLGQNHRILILDEKGKQRALVSTDITRPDGSIDSAKPTSIRLLEDDKTLEISYPSGKKVRVDTDAGQPIESKDAAIAPKPSTP